MLTAHHIFKSYGIQTVLSDISFSITQGERIGLIGPNGCGKSTLMHILTGIETPDSGTVIRTRPGLRIRYLAQGMEFAPEQTVQSTLSLAADKSDELDSEIASVAASLSYHPDDPALQARYDALLSLLSVGLLMALRIGLNTYSKAQGKMMDNRRVVGAQRILEQQLEGLVPVVAPCAGAAGQPASSSRVRKRRCGWYRRFPSRGRGAGRRRCWRFS